MLVFHLRNRHLDALIKQHSARGDAGAFDAALVRDYRKHLRSQISLFNQTQGQAIADRIPDGRRETISDNRAKVGGKFAISKSAGYLLRGVEISSARSINGAAHEDYSYACPLRLKTRLSESDGDPYALMIYLDLVRAAHIVWIGTRRQLPDGWAALDRMTDQLTDFGAIDAA